MAEVKMSSIQNQIYLIFVLYFIGLLFRDASAEGMLRLTEKVNHLTGDSTLTLPLVTEASNCAALYSSGITLSGVYTIKVAGKNVQVFCDMGDGGGWTVFQRRMDGSVDFFRDWNDYKNGFGNITGEHWLGNDILAAMTAEGSYTLRIEAKSFKNESGSYDYTNFKVDDESNKYKLSIDDIIDNNGLSVNNGMNFTTLDQDNDNFGQNCAKDNYKGGWWYSDDCGYTNLNGPYVHQSGWQGGGVIFWFPLDEFYAIPFSQMKFRPS